MGPARGTTSTTCPKGWVGGKNFRSSNMIAVVDVAKAKFEIATTDCARVQEENTTEHAVAKLATLKHKDSKTLGAAVDTKIALFGQLLMEKNRDLVVHDLDTATED